MKRIPTIVLPAAAAMLLFVLGISLFSCKGGGGGGFLLPPSGTMPHELYVADGIANNILVFDPTVTIDTAPIRVMGDMTGLRYPVDVVVHPARNEIFVSESSNNTILVYDRTAAGNTAPLRVLSKALPIDLAIDTKNNELFSLGSRTVTVYDVAAEGNAEPKRSLTLPVEIWYGNFKYDLSGYGALAVDTTNDEMIVLIQFKRLSEDKMTLYFASAVFVYSRDAEGNDAPLRSITTGGGVSYQSDLPMDVAVDPVNHELFLPRQTIGSGRIEVYDSTFSQTTPLRTLEGGLSSPLNIQIELDSENPDNSEILVLDGASVKTYARDASGSASPKRTLAGASTGLDPMYTLSMALDPSNGELFFTGQPAIIVHDSAAEGDASPKRVLCGALATGIISPRDVAVDVVHDEIYVVGPNYVGVYDRTATMDVRPKRRITGTATGLSGPSDLALDTTNGELFVANAGSNAVTVYDWTADGDSAPKRSIDGAATGLSGIQGIAVDAAREELYVLCSSSVAVFDRLASGTDQPKGIIQIEAEGYVFYANAFSVDSMHSEILVAWEYLGDDFLMHDAVLVYDLALNAAVPLKRTIEGATTGFSAPNGIAVDLKKDEIFVSNNWSGSITVHERTAEGDVAPKWTIGGPEAGFVSPCGIAVTW